MRIADIDIDLDAGLYAQLRPHFEGGMVRAFVTKREALAWAKEIGWRKDVLCVKHRYFRQWHVGMRVIVPDNPTMYTFWFPTGQYVTEGDESRMQLVEGVRNIKDYDAARLPAAA